MNKSISLLFFPVAIVTILLALVDRVAWLRSLHFAFILWLSVSLGALALLMTHHLSGGRWGFAVRRILEAALAPIPLFAVLFLVLFMWEPELTKGNGYFAARWVLLRAIICFGIWILQAQALRHLSIRQDESDDLRFTRQLRTLSGPGLVLYFLTVSIAFTDWVMNLEPGWRSTMFPGIMMASQVLLALSGSIVGAYFLFSRRTRGGFLATSQMWLDLGTLLFAFVIFWAYVAFSQLLIIWAGNLPAEAVWYQRRSAGGWQWMARLIGLICFFAPAAVLLFQSVKRDRFRLALVAAAVWVSQVVYLFWVVMPGFLPAFHLGVLDVLLTIFVGVLGGCFFWWAWSSALPIPQNDPRMERIETGPFVSPQE